jgi:hypothetical protein
MELALLWTKGSELCLPIVSTPQRPPGMRECGLLPPAISRWLCGLLRSGR